MISVDTILRDEHDVSKLSDLCRLCGVGKDSNILIYDDSSNFSYHKIINSHFKDDLQVAKSDHLPLKLCVNCLASLMSWHEFYHCCLSVNDRFKVLVEKFDLNKSKPLCAKSEEKVTYSVSNDIEVIEVKVDDASYDDTEYGEYDISNVSIKDSQAETNDDDFDDIGAVDDVECVADIENDIKDEPQTEKTTKKISQKNKIKKSTVCRICGKLYSSRSTYLKHLQKTHSTHPKTATKRKVIAKPRLLKKPEEEVPEICYYCGKTFKSKGSYRCHIKNVHMNENHPKQKRSRRMCELCGKICHGGGFKSHMNKHTNPEKLTCPDCGKIFAYTSSLKSHIQVSHRQERPYQCELCPSNFKRADYLRSHMKFKHEEHVEGIYRCEYCSNLYRTMESYRRHLTSHNQNWTFNKEQKFYCKLCGMSFKKRNYLLIHERYVHIKGKPYAISEGAEGQYKCDKCEKRFSSVSGRNYHCRKAHGAAFDTAFSAKCDHCGLTFRNRVFYAKHRAKLNGSPTCYLCWKSFPTDEGLAKHIDDEHFTDLPFVCEICRTRFVALKNLTHHLKTRHFNDKPFKCDLCPHRSARKDSMEIHIRGCHLGHKPYECTTCGKHFSQPTDLRKHELIHTRNK